MRSWDPTPPLLPTKGGGTRTPPSTTSGPTGPPAGRSPNEPTRGSPGWPATRRRPRSGGTCSPASGGRRRSTPPSASPAGRPHGRHASASWKEPATPDLAATYAEARRRLVQLVEGLEEPQLSSPVPACPDWTIRDILARVAPLGPRGRSCRAPPRRAGSTRAAWRSRRPGHPPRPADLRPLAGPAVGRARAQPCGYGRATGSGWRAPAPWPPLWRPTRSSCSARSAAGAASIRSGRWPGTATPSPTWTCSPPTRCHRPRCSSEAAVDEVEGRSGCYASVGDPYPYCIRTAEDDRGSAAAGGRAQEAAEGMAAQRTG